MSGNKDDIWQELPKQDLQDVMFTTVSVRNSRISVNNAFELN